MRKIVILGSVLAMLGVGSAAGSEATWFFAPSERNDPPPSRATVIAPVKQMQANPGLGSVRGSFGYSTDITGSINPSSGGAGRAGFSAARGFGPSDESDQPIPRFQKGY